MPVSDEDIKPAVVVEVREAAAPAEIAAAESQAGCKGGVGESPVAVVSVEAARIIREIRLEDVQPAVAIVVARGGAHACLLAAVFVVSAPGGDGNVRESSVAIVVIEDAGRGIARHVDVGPAIAIKIAAQGGERVVSRSLQDSRLRGDVRESCSKRAVRADRT